eukprot:TRINITY_DN20169_c0_g1_i1.p1 TRINITY_DN20169_c0_g1~~TRINITY_DN20169_c0_g1_i1.p1  ORF type:complete len:379 (-),score=56.90 TRINITY_DN20169_c0_g1_i1:58-1194(-)
MRPIVAVVSACCVAFAFAHVSPPLRTAGSDVVDSRNALVRFDCVNWYGAHMERYVVNGLDMQSVGSIASSIHSMGFNCVRLVFSNDLYFKNPTLNASAVTANPSFAGRPAMEAFDAVVEALTASGLMVILNNHISDAGWCCSLTDGNGLWYTDTYPHSKWRQMWVELANRYASNSLVVAFDLRNELRAANNVTPTWGTGNKSTDWRMAAQDCGDAVLAQNSGLLIIVEGLSYANILPVSKKPLKLAVPDRLVYSGHVYEWDELFNLGNYSEFSAAVAHELTFVTTLGKNFTAPFWLGEFGSNKRSTFWNWTINLLRENPWFGWAYWALDGYKNGSHGDQDEETFGIFEQDYKTIRHPWKLKDLQSVMRDDHSGDNFFL